MTDTLDMFSPPPFQRHSIQSREAAEQIADKTPTLRDQVLDFIRAHGPVTDEQIIDGLGLNPSTARPRRVELGRLGLVRPSGHGLTRAGRRATRWEVTRT